ncbi:MAG: xanthine dehydrogenase family protein molybdopterin-binding subunit [Sphingomonas sp.]|uniref:xanthine dehydrogenase family protein molybdopterin-binding subunit n=1 Tax=Sphingomonas sp. TaxID=28214 RepID=UPI0012245F77|nr:molybdopterin cofactor-binding domain-containing protein [Sphingomonas sp.]THD37401.1 MAG: xanthine dehydrogenase family protein molybdopterin-binding subunit [Sphingomonas sp.]
MTALQTDRRKFLAGTGVVLGLALPMRGAKALPAAPFAPNAFVRVLPDNTVSVVIKHVEFGQGPATGLTTIVADEMDADWAQMRIEFAPANDPLYKNLAFGTMGTGGSTAMGNSWMQMRNAGASARAMLVAAAAKQWGVPAGEVKVAKGVVSHGANKASFGDLAALAATMPVPEKPTLKTPEQWTLIGTDVPKIDSLVKSTGAAQFTMDVARPGMVVSVIEHAPAFGGMVKSVDDKAALAVPGVVAVKAIPQGVVVYAKDTFAAMKGRKALSIEWDLSKAETRSSERMIADYEAANANPGVECEANGDAAAAIAGAAKKIEAAYIFPFLAHAPMEPMDAVIESHAGGADFYVGSQFQVGDTRAVAGVLGVPFEGMTLHEQYAGGSFGRRATPDMGNAVEAAMAKKALGGTAPVKHMWTRENDIGGGRYRPLMVHRVSGGVDAKGAIVGLDIRTAGQSFMRGTAFFNPAEKFDDAMVEGLTKSAYAFPNLRVGANEMKNGVPTLWWRSVGNTHTAYVMETFLDRLIELGKGDPIKARLALMKEARARAVLSKCAELAGGLIAKSGRARGVAFHKSFGSYVAQIAEVSVGREGVPRVHKIWAAVDCGVAINPNVVRAQVEGGIGYGLGHALYSEITLGEGGVVQQSNFDNYRSLRIGEMPDVEVAIIKSTADPTGIGEPGLPPAAPAVANAWRRLTGKVVERLPFIHPVNTGGRA